MEITKPSHSWVTSTFGNVDDWMANHTIIQCAIALVALEIISLADISKHFVLASVKTAYTVVLLPTTIFDLEPLRDALVQVHDHVGSGVSETLGLVAAPLATVGIGHYGNAIWHTAKPPERLALEESVRNETIDLAKEVEKVKKLPAGSEQAGRTAELLKNSYELQDVIGDGNCGLRAIVRAWRPSCSIEEETTAIRKMRKEVVEHIKKNADRFSPFIQQNFSWYCYRMSWDGIWIGEPELQAISELYGLNIKVHGPGDLDTNLFGKLTTSAHKQYGSHLLGSTVRIYYDRQHYQALLPKT